MSRWRHARGMGPRLEAIVKWQIFILARKIKSLTLGWRYGVICDFWVSIRYKNHWLSNSVRKIFLSLLVFEIHTAHVFTIGNFFANYRQTDVAVYDDRVVWRFCFGEITSPRLARNFTRGSSGNSLRSVEFLTNQGAWTIILRILFSIPWRAWMISGETRRLPRLVLRRIE